MCERERESMLFNPFQPHRAESNAARTSPSRPQAAYPTRAAATQNSDAIHAHHNTSDSLEPRHTLDKCSARRRTVHNLWRGLARAQHRDYVCVCVRACFQIVLHVSGISGIQVTSLEHMLASLSLFVSCLLVLARLRQEPLLPCLGLCSRLY